MNYLRNGELFCPNDEMFKKELLVEAKFYQIQGMIAQIERDIHPFKSSVIIKDKSHRLAVMSWLPPGVTCSLLYRATINGKTPQDFHRCCDDKGPTLVVVQSGQYICGGYTSKTWQSRMYLLGTLS